MPVLPFKRISVVGLGYIGLPTAAMFASRKVEVVGVDVNQTTVDTINRGEVHIVEPDLDLVVRAVVKEGYLRATTVPEPAEAFLIAVPTPFKGENHDPDLRFIEAAARAIAPVLEAGNIVILESTSPVGATEAMAGWLADARPDLSFPQDVGNTSDIRVAHCPERVLPGKVMQELITNDRIIGGMTPACSQAAASLYQTFVKGDCVVASGPRVAEMTKLAENSFRDVNIAFANELSLICDELAMNVWELIALANRHPRVNILQPGPGVGGHCIAVDPWFIVNSSPKRSKIIRTAREVNESKPLWVIEKVEQAISLVKPSLSRPPRLACFGLTFKANTDDLRESPSLEIVRHFVKSKQAEVLIVEPHINALPHEICSEAQLLSPEKAMDQADICVLLVDHLEFRQCQPREGMAIIDTRGIWQKENPEAHEI